MELYETTSTGMKMGTVVLDQFVQPEQAVALSRRPS